VTAAKRKTPTVANGAARDGDSYLNAVDIEAEALWRVSFGYLINVAGSGNAITATSDTSLVVAITAYARPMGFYYVPTNANTSAVTINIDTVGAVSIKDKAGAALQGGEFAVGTLYPIVFDGTNFRAITVTAGAAAAIATSPDIIIQDQKANGTNGGTFNSGVWLTRTLNTAVRNAVSGASLASNQITLPAGTYYVEWSAPGNAVFKHQTKLKNVTDGTDIAFGTSEYAQTGVQTRSFGEARFTITSSKAFEIQHAASVGEVTDGFGAASSFGNIEVYSDVKIWKQ